MNEIKAGYAIREHRANSDYKLIGRIIYINKFKDLAVISKIPSKNKHGHQKNYVPKPIILHLSSLQQEIDKNIYEIIDFDTPSHWLLTSEQLRNNSTSGLQKDSRRDLKLWLQKRAKAYQLIRPFVHERSIEEIIFDPKFSGWPAVRARELNLSGCARIYRALNAYLLALGNRNGLLPWYGNCGNPGVQKFSKKKTGRPKEFSDGVDKIFDGVNCSSEVRKIFAMGWKKFKKPQVSVSTAFNKTLEEWFCKSIQWNGITAKVKLKAEAHFYTEEQFEYWGKSVDGALTATEINQGETQARRNFQRRQGKFSDKHITANGEALLDSTSCDQTLVSCASRLKVLSSPWRTEVIGASVNYIFGHHVGFENPSSMTAMMAILHAAEDKVEYCARFGIKIKPRDWLPMTFRQFVMDNGEGKGQLVMRTLETMESGASFGSAYDSINKAPAESNHAKTQRSLDHLMPGSTMGRRARRGEPDRSTLARQNYFEYMPRLIENVIYHNNTEIIEIPTIEMRRDGVEPTRRGVLEWMIETGYIVSAPTDIQLLRISCLPKLDACLQSDGLHIYDPTYNGRRIIPKLVYTNDWIQRSGILDTVSVRRWKLEVHLNPNDLSRVWVNLQGLKCLTLKCSDPEMLRITLLDWLAISRDDRLVGFLARADMTKEGVNRVASIKRATSDANRERNTEIKERGKKPTKSEQKRDKRENTSLEKSAINGMPIPPVKKPPLHPEFSSKSTSASSFNSTNVVFKNINTDLTDAIRVLRQS